MKVERIDRHSFHILLEEWEVSELEKSAVANKKDVGVFLHWLIRVGQKIDELTDL